MFISKFKKSRLIERTLSIIKPNKKSVKDALRSELDLLWSIVRCENSLNTDVSIEQLIEDSFTRMEKKYTKNELDSVYFWPKYLKLSVNATNKIFDSIIDYLDESNYTILTRDLSNVSNSIHSSDDTIMIERVEKYAQKIYKHILNKINPKDIPSALALGRMAQGEGDYETARSWYAVISDSFSGITATLKCYEDEVKQLFKEQKYNTDNKTQERIYKLNKEQQAIYESNYRQMRIQNESINELAEQSAKNYVALVTKYSRFERNRGNYDKALNLLESLSECPYYRYRVVVEIGMLYQHKARKNKHYDLKKALEEFKEAEELLYDEKLDSVNSIDLKSVLMPMANTYFALGKYQKAEKTCNKILEIDPKEQRAIQLKKRVSSIF